MEEKQIRALTKAIERLIGNPLEAGTQEVEELFAEIGGGMDPSERLHGLVSAVARECRLEGASLPSHVAEALKFTRRALSLEASTEIAQRSVVDALLNPIVGPVQQVSFAFRNRRGSSAKDRALLEGLSNELKRDWSGEK